MRRHTWNVFAGLTSVDKKSGLPVFRTWYRKCQLNSGFPCGYEVPAQLLDSTPGPFSDRSREIALAVSVNFYNQDFRDFVIHQVPGKPSTPLCDGTVLAKLKEELKRNNQIEDRKIEAFPSSAIAIKTGWRIVKKSGLTLLPVWDPNANSQTDPNGQSPVESSSGISYPKGRWSRYVAVDPTPYKGRGIRYENVVANDGLLQHVRVVPLSSFYHITPGTTDLERIKELTKGRLPSNVDAGDYLVLVALHFTTKEIPNWVWGTFWWHDEPDTRPNGFDRPSSVIGEFRNYLMNTSYGMNDPRESDGHPHIAFNPWLEGPLKGGVESNCMSCHRRAAWPLLPSSAINTTPGEVSLADDSAFGMGQLKTDFIWTLGAIDGTKNGCPVEPISTPIAVRP